MIRPKHYLLPTAREQKAIAETYASVILRKKQNKILSDTVYANTFFKYFFGKSNPSVAELNTLITSSLNKTEKIILINNFIKSNGTRFLNVERSFALKCFPSLGNSLDHRFNAHCRLKFQQERNVATKVKVNKACLVDTLIDSLMLKTNKELALWLDETAEHMTNREQLYALEKWYKKHRSNAKWSFYDLYLSSTMNASQVAFDLSFDD